MSFYALGIISEWEKITPQQLAVGFYLADCHNQKTGKCFPSIDYIADRLSLSHRQTQRILSSLAESSLVTIKHNYDENGRQKTSDYTFVLKDRGDTGDMGEGDTHDTHEGDTHVRGEGDTHVLHNQEEVIRKSNQEDINKTPVIPADIDPELWEGLMQSRKKLKAQNTPLAVKLLLTSLDKCVDAGFTRNEAISEAIERGWKSVKPEWLKNSSKSSFAEQREERNKKAGEDFVSGNTKSIFNTTESESANFINSTCERIQ